MEKTKYNFAGFAFLMLFLLIITMKLSSCSQQNKPDGHQFHSNTVDSVHAPVDSLPTDTARK